MRSQQAGQPGTDSKSVFRSKGSRGFTLIEVVVALLAFAAIVVIFDASIILSEKASYMNGQYAQAISLCQHKIDEVRAVGFGRLDYTDLLDADIIAGSPQASPYAFSASDGVGDVLPNATTSLTVGPWPGDPTNTAILQVSATVTWTPASFNSKTSSLTLTGLITNVE